MAGRHQPRGGHVRNPGSKATPDPRTGELLCPADHLGDFGSPSQAFRLLCCEAGAPSVLYTKAVLHQKRIPNGLGYSKKTTTANLSLQWIKGPPFSGVIYLTSGPICCFVWLLSALKHYAVPMKGAASGSCLCPHRYAAGSGQGWLVRI